MVSMQHRHFVIHKPYGVLSQFMSNDAKSHKKKFLGELANFPKGTMAVGRLDEKSEGLLLLTTNGKISNAINGGGIEKEYYAQVDGVITIEAIKKMALGVAIGNNGTKYLTKPCKVRSVANTSFPKRTQKIRDDRHGPTSWVSITLSEGKFRQVRKMTSAVGFPTLRLIRVRVGEIYLGNLLSGESREVPTFF